jgi:hypothetical protein
LACAAFFFVFVCESIVAWSVIDMFDLDWGAFFWFGFALNGVSIIAAAFSAVSTQTPDLFAYPELQKLNHGRADDYGAYVQPGAYLQPGAYGQCRGDQGSFRSTV